MSKKSSKSLSDLLGGPESPIGQLAGEARRRSELSDHLRKALPADLAGGLMHCNFDSDGGLILLAASPEWAARLRFESQLVIDLCRTQGLEINQVRVRVAAG